MLITTLKDQLGNQMFSYATIKSIAIDKGIEFGFLRIPLNKELINDTDAKYGNDLYSIFDLPEIEWIKESPDNYKLYKEKSMKYRNKKEYTRQLFNDINDNYITDGHFITSEFIKSKRQLLKEWFTIPRDIDIQSTDLLCKIKKENQGKKIVSVHFRVGDDYKMGGFRISSSYWFKAAEYVKNRVNDPVFVVFYDKKNVWIERFVNEYNAIEIHGSLIEDMCMISKCDINIVCNSTFSVMASLLNLNSEFVVRPSRYPSEGGDMPEDIFLSEWVKIGGVHRDVSSFIHYVRRRYIRKQNIRNILINNSKLDF